MAAKILIAGGGTGGHIFPAIAIAKALMKANPELRIHFAGSRRKLEMQKVPEAGFTITGLPVMGFQRRITWKNILFFIYLWQSMRISHRLVKKFRPDVAVGVGGYASGPALKAAAKRNVPVVIQEQNSYAGVTNRLLAKNASKVFVAWEGMDKFFPEEKIILTGNPVREDIVNNIPGKRDAAKILGLDPQKPVVLILGGSLGAGSINQGIQTGLESFGTEIQLIWQTGKYYFDKIEKETAGRRSENILVTAFLSDMHVAYGAADVIISRAGAGTLSELGIVGKPVILVPSPNVAEDHQTKNAHSLVEKDAALMVKDEQTDEELVNVCLGLLADKERQEKLSKNIKATGIKDAAEKIATEILKLL